MNMGRSCHRGCQVLPNLTGLLYSNVQSCIHLWPLTFVKSVNFATATVTNLETCKITTTMIITVEERGFWVEK